MSVSVDFFFSGLNVDVKHYVVRFKQIGVQDRFFLSRSDLELIVKKLPSPRARYKTALVVKRAKDLLQEFDHVRPSA
ncbi:hypothetical protein E0765_07025 [Sulfuricurvum sp. IAE1]|uniref:hypothetical protein n=1 Tax=Sulfuricurvum sp. IAE1 TaxID=2546102 RepID=UPI0010476D13|nr:hypothetical protein [Sulfuricurvum sp. IAE1]TDA63580.1 hypothetical protein E0765_07025 [Sulfuricurvum sp. IAE1]